MAVLGVLAESIEVALNIAKPVPKRIIIKIIRVFFMLFASYRQNPSEKIP